MSDYIEMCAALFGGVMCFGVIVELPDDPILPLWVFALGVANGAFAVGRFFAKPPTAGRA